MRYRTMDIEQQKKLNSVLKQNTQPTATVQRNTASPLQTGLMAVQAGFGNRYIQRMVDSTRQGGAALPIQAKLIVGPAQDEYEREADRMAAHVMSMSETTANMQRMNEGEEEKIQAKPLAATITPLVPRIVKPDDSFEPDVNFEGSLAFTRGGGSSLPAPTRQFMEQRFGADFSGVRVHTDSASSKLNREINAQAFTLGEDIYLDNGRGNVESNGGKQLLAHELTHVLQQTAAHRVQRTNQQVESLSARKSEHQPTIHPGPVTVSLFSGATIQKKELTREQEADYTSIVTSITGNNGWGGPSVLLSGVLAELKKLAADDVAIISELKQVFVEQNAKLIYDEKKAGTGEYDYKSNEMRIGPQSAAGMADTIIFESGNARRRSLFQGADEMLKQREANALTRAGGTKAEIEAGTTMDYFDHILKMIENDRTFGQLPLMAKRQFKYFMEKYPDYFNMNAKRKAEFRESYKKEMRTSPHEAKAAAGTRMHLNSQDLYAYERVVQTLAISGVLSLIKGYVENKKGFALAPRYWNGGEYISDIEKKPPMIKTASDNVPDASRGKFYMVAVERAERYYKIDLGDIKFNAAQAEVAEREHSTTSWNPARAFGPPARVWDSLPPGWTLAMLAERLQHPERV